MAAHTTVALKRTVGTKRAFFLLCAVNCALGAALLALCLHARRGVFRRRSGSARAEIELLNAEALLEREEGAAAASSASPALNWLVNVPAGTFVFAPRVVRFARKPFRCAGAPCSPWAVAPHACLPAAAEPGTLRCATAVLANRTLSGWERLRLRVVVLEGGEAVALPPLDVFPLLERARPGEHNLRIERDCHPVCRDSHAWESLQPHEQLGFADSDWLAVSARRVKVTVHTTHSELSPFLLALLLAALLALFEATQRCAALLLLRREGRASAAYNQ